MGRIGDFVAHARAYAHEFVDFRAGADALGQRVFTEQLEATTAAVRWIAPLSVVVTLAVSVLFWHAAYRPMLLPAEAIDLGICLWVWFRLPAFAARNDNHAVARRHAVIAMAHGSAWALVTMSLMAHDGEIHVATLTACLQLAMISIALVQYVNLPAAIPLFAIPSAIALMATFAGYGDHTVVAVPLALVFLGIVAKVGVDQSRMFIRSARLGDELGRAEAQRRALAEEQMRETERRSVETRAAEEARRRQMLAVAERFEREVLAAAAMQADAMATLQHSTVELDTIVGAAAAASDRVAQRSGVAAAAVATLAAAVDEMSVAIASIAARIGEHAISSERAQRSATSSEGRIATMAEATGQVDAIVALIQDMTRQTTMLSLNATIEAARAGDAGRGFAVVAGEVKSLAERSSVAAHGITEQVDGIAKRIGSAITSIRDTAGEIESVAAIAASMAHSIEEQRRTTEEMGRESGTVAREVEDVRGQIAELAKGARSAGTLTAAVSDTARRVSGEAQQLRTATATFLRDLRAA